MVAVQRSSLFGPSYDRFAFGSQYSAAEYLFALNPDVMAIPPRFRLKHSSETLVREMCGLCTDIERAIENGVDVSELLAKWHEHASRRYDPAEFTSYWKAVDREEFVREALNPRPKIVEDLLYAEAADVLASISAAEPSENELSYYLEWLDLQFPEANISDLIYWPDEWFDDPALVRNANGSFKREAELSIDQMLGYAMAKSGRSLPGAPVDIVLPFPIPTNW
jgi:hypothetical protein